MGSRIENEVVSGWVIQGLLAIGEFPGPPRDQFTGLNHFLCQAACVALPEQFRGMLYEQQLGLALDSGQEGTYAELLPEPANTAG